MCAAAAYRRKQGALSYIVVYCLRSLSLDIMRICNRHAAARHTYTYNNFKFMFFRAAAKRQLWNQTEKKKFQEKWPIFIPRCVVYAQQVYQEVHPVPKCTKCSLNLFSYVAAAQLFFIFFPQNHFCCVPLMIIIWNKNSRRVLYASIEFSAL